jgi:hypothetical protein
MMGSIFGTAEVRRKAEMENKKKRKIREPRGCFFSYPAAPHVRCPLMSLGAKL